MRSGQLHGPGPEQRLAPPSRGRKLHGHSISEEPARLVHVVSRLFAHPLEGAVRDALIQSAPRQQAEYRSKLRADPPWPSHSSSPTGTTRSGDSSSNARVLRLTPNRASSASIATQNRSIDARSKPGTS